jgi:hypothetical protein
MRAHLTGTALVWLLVQLAGLAVSPLALCCSAVAATLSAGEADACCEALGPGQTCPLHHHTRPCRPAHDPINDDPGDCALRNCAPDAPAIVSLIVEPGLIETVASIDLAPAAAPVFGIVLSALTRSELPDTPPPRS